MQNATSTPLLPSLESPLVLAALKRILAGKPEGKAKTEGVEEMKTPRQQALNREEILTLAEAPLSDLTAAANTIRAHFCGKAFDLCSIMNVKSGVCSENCAFCAQSSHHHATIDVYPLVSSQKIIQQALSNSEQGAHRFSLVTSGARLTDREVEHIACAIEEISHTSSIALCASLGLLSRDQFTRLKDAGLTRVHNNLETSRRFFPQICTTHSYDEKLETIHAAQAAGLAVCSGGIIGMGESLEDRIDMAFELRELKVVSVPINILNPIAQTPLANQSPLALEEILRSIALMRFVLPRASLRLAGGRGLLDDAGRACFTAGANAAISGDMLTTAGLALQNDRKMIVDLGFIAQLS